VRRLWALRAYTDTPLTEKLDYFAAALAILYALYMAVIRLFHLYTGTRAFPSRPGRRLFFYVWRALTALVYLAHVTYLCFAARFDYTYNIIFNLVLGLVHNAFWLMFAFPGSAPFARFADMPRSYRPAHAGTAALTVALTTAATMLELLDFPPWRRVVDAHALWHLATVPLAVMWYDFLLTDAQDAGWKGQKL
jgi:post-GPI attachment to proteins factor 3